MELSIVSLCRINAASLATTADIILTGFAFFMYSILIVFMLYSGPFLHINHHRINQTDFKNKFGALAEGLNEEKTSMIFPTLFMLRRLIVALIIVYMHDKSFFQIQLIAFLSSLVMVYQGSYRPQES